MKRIVECGYSGLNAANDLTGDGPTILVDVGFDPEWRIGLIPVASDRNIVGLIDTGAQECFIDCDLANRLALPIVDRREVAGSNGKHEVDVYLAQIFSPDLLFIQQGRFAGAYLKRGGMPYEVLMGRTFLERFILVYDGPSGRVTLSGPVAEMGETGTEFREFTPEEIRIFEARAQNRREMIMERIKDWKGRYPPIREIAPRQRRTKVKRAG